MTLPPELRNKIYGLVLGGKTIHIYDTKEGGFRSTYCCSKIDDEQYGKHAGASPDRTEDLYQTTHSKKCCIDLKDFCRRSPDSRISLGFLATCSKVYNEAALIPFADNTFSFNCDRDLSTFVASLIPAQHQTIRAICLPDAGNHNFVKDDVWSKLTSLRRLNIVIQIRSRGKITCARSRMSLTATELRTIKGTLPISSLKRLNLTFFQLNVVASGRSLASCPGFVEIQRSSRIVELDVLKGWDEEAELASSENKRQRRWLRGSVGRLTRFWGRGTGLASDEAFVPGPCVHST